MTGYGEVLKALSAIASITSYSPGKNGTLKGAPLVKISEHMME